MFDFIKSYLNKKALMQAIKELDEEANVGKITKPAETSTNLSVKRDYQTVSEADSFKALKIKTAINKPQTSAVDLKDFKDWRNVNKVESKNPVYNKPLKSFSFDDDEDDGEQPEIDFPSPVSKRSPVSRKTIIDSVAEGKKEENRDNIDTSIDSFFKEKFGIIKKTESSTINEPLTNEEQKQEVKEEVKPVNSEPKRPKTTLNQLLNKKLQENPHLLDNIKQNNSNETKDDNKKSIKVEVVDFSDKNPEKPKKVVNRKPRGKNKRRFDADVISNIDWK